jgi:hypothetical protein
VKYKEEPKMFSRHLLQTTCKRSSHQNAAIGVRHIRYSSYLTIPRLFSIRSSTSSTNADGSSACSSITHNTVITRLNSLDFHDNISVLHHSIDSKAVVLVGTVHISEQSVALVKKTIQTLQPNLVMIESDLDRIDLIRDGGKNWKEVFLLTSEEMKEAEDRLEDIEREEMMKETTQNTIVLRLEQLGNFFYNIAIAPIRNLLAFIIYKIFKSAYKEFREVGFEIGGEFRIAIKEAKACNAKVILGDKRANNTLEDLADGVRKTGFIKYGNFYLLIVYLDFLFYFLFGFI